MARTVFMALAMSFVPDVFKAFSNATSASFSPMYPDAIKPPISRARRSRVWCFSPLTADIISAQQESKTLAPYFPFHPLFLFSIAGGEGGGGGSFFDHLDMSK